MEVLEIINLIGTSIIIFGGIIYGTIKLIQSKSKSAKDEAIIQSNKDIEFIRKSHDQEIKEIHVELNTVTERLDEVDKWRKDMNGQLKLMNERQKFTNQILEEQKNNLVLVTQTLNSLSTDVAVVSQFVKKNESNK